ncbi:MAG: septum site-determining protein MinD [Clostridia bacterium]|nr:septum site-determining protein MinD [Clostridia bacterium]
MGRIIVVTSGKGGVGKTTVTASLSVALASLGKRVVAIDADVSLNNLDLALGLEGAIAYDLYDVVSGNCRVRQALVRYPPCENLQLLPSVHPLGNVDAQAFRELAVTLSESNDFVLVDCPAGVDDGFARAARAANEALVVTTPHTSALRDADKVLGILDGFNLSRCGLVLNRLRGDMIVEGSMLSPKQIASLLHVRLVGCIPEDDNVLFMCGTTPRECEHHVAVAMLAKVLLGADRGVYDVTAPYRGALGKLRRIIKKV